MTIKVPIRIVYLMRMTGGQDNTHDQIQKLASANKRVRLLALSRNFGKEITTTTVSHYVKGDAVIIIDANVIKRASGSEGKSCKRYQ